MKRVISLIITLVLLTSCQHVEDFVGDDVIDRARETVERAVTFVHDSGAFDRLRDFEQSIRESAVVEMPSIDGIADISLEHLTDAIDRANELREQFTDEFLNSDVGEQVKEIERAITIDISTGEPEVRFIMSPSLAEADVDNLIVRADVVEIGFRPQMLREEFQAHDEIHIGVLNDDSSSIITFEDQNENEIRFQNNVTISITDNSITNHSVVFNVQDGSNVLIGGRMDDNRLVFQTREGGEFTIGTNRVEFADISGEDRETQEAIEYLAARGIFDLLTEMQEFLPNSTVTRADAVTMITKTLFLYDEDNAANFTDVSRGEWHYTAVASAAAEDIIVGYPDNTFRPQNAISKQELLVIAANTLISDRQHILPGDPQMFLGDFEEEIAYWARAYVALCVRDGIIEQGSIYDGAGAISRAQAAVILYNLFMMI
jgi:hypothetical protein